MTSIEWLIEALENPHKNINWEDTKQQAKEMHKVEIIESFKEGTKMNDVQDELSAGFNAVMYYYEKYTNDEG
jgi:hypothetical protein